MFHRERTDVPGILKEGAFFVFFRFLVLLKIQKRPSQKSHKILSSMSSSQAHYVLMSSLLLLLISVKTATATTIQTGVNVMTPNHTKCRDGYYTSQVGVCTVCSAGHFKNTESSSTGAADTCTAHQKCAAGKWTSKAGNNVTDTQCTVCSLGRWRHKSAAKSDGVELENNVCSKHVKCPAGLYTKVPGNHTSNPICVTCADGMFKPNVSLFSTAIDDCKNWRNCLAEDRALVTPGTTKSDNICGRKCTAPPEVLPDKSTVLFRLDQSVKVSIDIPSQPNCDDPAGIARRSLTVQWSVETSQGSGKTITNLADAVGQKQLAYTSLQWRCVRKCSKCYVYLNDHVDI